MTIKYYGQTTTYIDANGMKTLRFENIVNFWGKRRKTLFRI